MECKKQRTFASNMTSTMFSTRCWPISPVHPPCPNEFGTVNHSIQRGATGLPVSDQGMTGKIFSLLLKKDLLKKDIKDFFVYFTILGCNESPAFKYPFGSGDREDPEGKRNLVGVPVDDDVDRDGKARVGGGVEEEDPSIPEFEPAQSIIRS
ncbi:hypothetical protein WN48_08856 [Eufriesea mexicana]|uniref:Uncharacterized protein n=1 Tax=Eufriesea mexicana TaxID=516756 RepID=A0A310SEU9_9HYME|nr:hypothetical protein WN48_08856 [Eufriesea mexicana]